MFYLTLQVYDCSVMSTACYLKKKKHPSDISCFITQQCISFSDRGNYSSIKMKKTNLYYTQSNRI